MPVKVKRGLGLLVVAVLALCVAYPAGQAKADAWGVVSVLASAVCVLALASGLVLLAWGLLRD
jgi:hypothetical protein